jgi:hypothetical protein
LVAPLWQLHFSYMHATPLFYLGARASRSFS